MFEAVLATFLLGSVFLNRAHFDLIYHYVAIILVFGKVAREEMSNEQAYPVRATGTRSPLVTIDTGGFGRQPQSASGFRNTSLSPRRA